MRTGADPVPQDPPAQGATNLPLVARGACKVLELQSYNPFVPSAIGNKGSRGASTRYLKDIGVGLTEWRILAMPTIEPRVTACLISQVIGPDKAAASRALRAMEDRGLVRSWQEDSANHRKLLELTGQS